jgi:hypothetical protein
MVVADCPRTTVEGTFQFCENHPSVTTGGGVLVEIVVVVLLLLMLMLVVEVSGKLIPGKLLGKSGSTGAGGGLKFGGPSPRGREGSGWCPWCGVGRGSGCGCGERLSTPRASGAATAAAATTSTQNENIYRASRTRTAVAAPRLRLDSIITTAFEVCSGKGISNKEREQKTMERSREWEREEERRENQQKKKKKKKKKQH